MSDHFLDVDGKVYYFDLDNVFNAVKMDYVEFEQETTSSGQTNQIINEDVNENINEDVNQKVYFDAAYNPTKYETLRNIIEVFFNELNVESGDNALGITYILENQGNFYFTLAFNTLVKYGILKIKDKYDE